MFSRILYKDPFVFLLKNYQREYTAFANAEETLLSISVESFFFFYCRFFCFTLFSRILSHNKDKANTFYLLYLSTYILFLSSCNRGFKKAKRISPMLCPTVPTGATHRVFHSSTSAIPADADGDRSRDGRGTSRGPSRRGDSFDVTTKYGLWGVLHSQRKKFCVLAYYNNNNDMRVLL